MHVLEDQLVDLTELLQAVALDSRTGFALLDQHDLGEKVVVVGVHEVLDLLVARLQGEQVAAGLLSQRLRVRLVREDRVVERGEIAERQRTGAVLVDDLIAILQDSRLQLIAEGAGMFGPAEHVVHLVQAVDDEDVPLQVGEL